MDLLLCPPSLSPASTFGADSSDLAVAATPLQLPAAAGTSDSKGNAGPGNGVDESRLSCACSGGRHATSLRRGKALMGHAAGEKRL